MKFNAFIVNLDRYYEDLDKASELQGERLDIDVVRPSISDYGEHLSLPVDVSTLGKTVEDLVGASPIHGYRIESVDTDLWNLDYPDNNILKCNELIREINEKLDEYDGTINYGFYQILDALMEDGMNDFDEALNLVDDVDIIDDCWDEEMYGHHYVDENCSVDYELEDYINYSQLGQDKLDEMTFYCFSGDDLYYIQ